ncbi:MAG: YoaK family protein [Propionibacteriaceae bacterium]
MAERAWPEREYSLALLVLTAATGAIDGVSYLALDRVFTGNMTGNVLFIGFGLVGVEGIPVLNNLIALLTFMLGAVLASRIIGRDSGPARLPRSALVLLLVGTVLVLLLAVVWLAVGAIGTPVMIIITGVLALLLGGQAAAVKPIGIRDLSTVVVTMTMVNLSSDSRLAGGRGTAWFRRFAAIGSMGLGALASALVTLHLGGAYALLLAGVVMAVGVLLMGRARRLDLHRGALARLAEQVTSR